ncbi:EamA family transporter RarD [Cupriavidus agavae]|uniref:Chloramphenicol-sensitive protein RarD n=1 Tax=Cupriavidus agavae TaxID=1001822 RepID=A0A4Q7RWS0_9BURK|nr:EamA family transporter RarD [Cupriavidus agavae]RZT38374.1 chloramphenicol-sensitive protein RarD [Cupriavidus agavae]
MQLGILYALLAYIIWGLLPLYIKSLHGVAPLEILLHRMVWSLVFLGAILLWRRHFGWLREVVANPRLILNFAASAGLLCCNWFLYIWAVSADRVVDASLGYFINPLVSVLLGVVLLHERLRWGQWVSIAVAGAGVLWLTWSAGHLPWIALGLAASFGGYGLLRKTGALGALEGLSLETLLLFPVAAIALGALFLTGHDTTRAAPTLTQGLLLLAGPVTAVPLLFFAAGARRIPLSMLGILQYAGPTIQLMLGLWLWHEPFPVDKQIGYALIWVSLAIYAFEGLLVSRLKNRSAIDVKNKTA